MSAGYMHTGVGSTTGTLGNLLVANFPPKKKDSLSSSKCRADQITQPTKGLDSTSVKLK